MSFFGVFVCFCNLCKVFVVSRKKFCIQIKALCIPQKSANNFVKSQKSFLYQNFSCIPIKSFLYPKKFFCIPIEGFLSHQKKFFVPPSQNVVSQNKKNFCIPKKSSTPSHPKRTIEISFEVMIVLVASCRLII